MSTSLKMLKNFRVPSDWTLDERGVADLEMLKSGAFAPLTGYLNADDYMSVLENMRLKNGSVWPIPITLPIPQSALSEESQSQSGDTAAGTETTSCQIIKLRDNVGVVIAEVYVSDIYIPDYTYEMKCVLGSTDTNHPYGKTLMKYAKDEYVYIGGDVKHIHPILHFDFQDLRLDTSVCKDFMKDVGDVPVIGFQTRNPMHRSHFELTVQAVREVKEATGKTPYLFLTPAVGPTQPGDVDYPIRVRCYKRILKYYKDICHVKLILLPLAMRMAGPREAVWHAIIRKNYGCTHFIVGRDHAGPSASKADGKPFYGPYEAHELLKTVESELGIVPVFGKAMAYVQELDEYMPADKVPQDCKPMNISGTRFREMLVRREPVPEWFCFPEVVQELHKFYRPLSECGFCVYFTGLPCSGKSTLAVALEAALQSEGRRRVTVLDADIIRTHLSKGLGFSKAERSLNVRRIGYVVSEVVKHGGICLVANIAPYEEDRLYNRNLVESTGGGYFEVYVSTPLDVCEGRDIKELYKKARLGIIKQFTGVSDPYEIPKHPDLELDSSHDIVDKVNQILHGLKEKGWVSFQDNRD